MDSNAPLEIGQNCPASFIDSQQQVAFRRKIQAIDVGAVRKWKGIRGIAENRKSATKGSGSFVVNDYNTAMRSALTGRGQRL